MDFQALVSRMLADEDFAFSIARDPENALRAAGVEPTRERLEALMRVTDAFIRFMSNAFRDNNAGL